MFRLFIYLFLVLDIGRSPSFEVRKQNTQGFSNEIVTVEEDPSCDENSHMQEEIISRDPLEINGERFVHSELTNAAEMLEGTLEDPFCIHLYVYGVRAVFPWNP